jgi:hypothetical protein
MRKKERKVAHAAARFFQFVGLGSRQNWQGKRKSRGLGFRPANLDLDKTIYAPDTTDTVTLVPEELTWKCSPA